MKSKIIISLIIIFIALVLTSGIIWFIYNYDIPDNHRQTMVQINKDTAVIWEFKDELPDTLSVYTTPPRDDNELFDHILEYCGFPKLNYFPGTSFSNDSWRLFVEEDGSIVCYGTNWRTTEEIEPLPYSEAELTAKKFIEEWLELDNAEYNSLGPTLGNDVPYYLLFTYRFDGQYNAEFPIVLTIGLYGEDVVDLRISHEEIKEIGTVRTIKLQEIMRSIYDLDWYLINGNLTAEEHADTLMIKDVEIVYLFEDTQYIPYISLIAEAHNTPNSGTVMSEYIKVYTGPIIETTEKDSYAVTESMVAAIETNNR